MGLFPAAAIAIQAYAVPAVGIVVAAEKAVEHIRNHSEAVPAGVKQIFGDAEQANEVVAPRDVAGDMDLGSASEHEPSRVARSNTCSIYSRQSSLVERSGEGKRPVALVLACRVLAALEMLVEMTKRYIQALLSDLDFVETACLSSYAGLLTTAGRKRHHSEMLQASTTSPNAGAEAKACSSAHSVLATKDHPRLQLRYVRPVSCSPSSTELGGSGQCTAGLTALQQVLAKRYDAGKLMRRHVQVLMMACQPVKAACQMLHAYELMVTPQIEMAMQ